MSFTSEAGKTEVYVIYLWLKSYTQGNSTET